MLETSATMQDQKQPEVTENYNSTMEGSAAVSAAPPPPPLPPTPAHNRRPRVREVSSRFMSPVVSNVQRRPRQPEMDPLGAADENRPIENSETPFPVGSQCKANLGTLQRKQRPLKLFKENGGGGRVELPPHPSKSCSGRIGSGFATPSRPDTPTVTVPSRYRLTSQQRSGSLSSTAATKLLQASGMSLASQSSTSNQPKGNVRSPKKEANTVPMDNSSVCSNDDNQNSEVNCSTQSLPELRSSLPEGDMLPTVCTRSVAEKTGNRSALSSSGDCLKFPSTPLSRSVTLPSSGSEHSLFPPIRGSEKQMSSLSKQYINSAKVGGLSLPPVPPCAKPGIDVKKGKKGSSHQEDVHSLRLLYNRYLQWRYANAKAESSLKARQRESEKALYSLAMKISELRDSVNRERIELGLLQRTKTLSTILEAQIPYLDEWSSLERDYLVSLTELVQALVNASVQLPIGGNIRADLREIGEALNSAFKLIEIIFSHVQRFIPKAEEIDISVSELARVVGGERALIGECEGLLSETHKSQVEEWSLRGQLIQMHSLFQKDKTGE